MIATKFEPHDNWLPPCYLVPRELERALVEAGLPAGVWGEAEVNQSMKLYIHELLFFNLYWNLLLFETNTLFFSIIKIQLYFSCEETYVFKYEREEHHYEHLFLHLFLGSVLKRFMWALFYPPIKISYLLRKSYFHHFAGDRIQVAIAIFPITAATICLAAVSQVGRTPVVANTNLLLRAVALLPPRLYS